MNNFMQPNGSSLYGNYRTRIFSEIFNSAELFKEEWEKTAFPAAIEEINTELIFFLLYSRYGNSSIASSDENQFKYKLFSYVFQYAPSWQKELEVQKAIRELKISDLQHGATNIVNNANNPSGAPATDSREALPYINAQNVSMVERSVADGYALLMSLLKDDVTENFIARFRTLFLTVVAPELPLWYENNPMED